MADDRLARETKVRARVNAAVAMMPNTANETKGVQNKWAIFVITMTTNSIAASAPTSPSRPAEPQRSGVVTHESCPVPCHASSVRDRQFVARDVANDPSACRRVRCQPFPVEIPFGR
jgi:hypothetical protein